MSDFTVFYRFQAETSKFKAQLSGIDKALKKVAISTKRVQESANQMSGKAFGAFAKLGAGITALAVPIYNFELETNKMVAASGKSHKAMKPLIELSKELGATTEHSASAAMSAATKLMQAGFTQNQALQLLPQTLQLATAGGIDMAESSSILSDAVKSFGLEANQSQRIVDVLAKGATMAKLEVGDFGEVIGKVGGISRLQNQSFEQTMAMFMAIKDTGLDASTSATGLGSIMQRLSKPAKEARGAFNELGINIEDVIAHGGQFDDVMLMLSKHHLTTAQAAKIFGLQQAKVGVALAQNYKVAQKYTVGLEHSQGSAKKMQDTMNHGLVGATKRFTSALEGLVLQGGEQGVSGAISKLLDKGTALITTISKMGIHWDKLIKYTLLATGGFLAFGVAMKTIAIGATIIRGITLAMIGLKWAVWGATIAMETNPLILAISGIVVAIIGLIKAFELLYVHWEKVKAFFNDMSFTKIVKTLGNLMQAGMLIDLKAQIGEMVVDKLEDHVDKLKENKKNEESKQKVVVENKTTVEGEIDVRTEDEGVIAGFKSLIFGGQ